MRETNSQGKARPPDFNARETGERHVWYPNFKKSREKTKVCASTAEKRVSTKQGAIGSAKRKKVIGSDAGCENNFRNEMTRNHQAALDFHR